MRFDRIRNGFFIIRVARRQWPLCVLFSPRIVETKRNGAKDLKRDALLLFRINKLSCLQLFTFAIPRTDGGCYWRMCLKLKVNFTVGKHRFD